MKTLTIMFNDGIDAISRKLMVHQCGNCGGYCAIEPDPEPFCPYCILAGKDELKPVEVESVVLE
jgi:hypothetical protein